MEIVTSRISVYEIELDLTGWSLSDTSQAPGYPDRLFDALPSLNLHKCTSGEAGGFKTEVFRGTNFAHVIEHVILELLRLSHPDKERFTGWTRELDTSHYVIHYSAPDFLTARLAAIRGVDLVKKLLQGESVNREQEIHLLKNPLDYFSQEEDRASAFDRAEPASVIEALSGLADATPARETCEPLSREQESNIRTILKKTERHMTYIADSWRHAFLKYSGEFGDSILDKIELINLDKFNRILVAGDYQGLFRGIRKACQVIAAYRIPNHFVVHSAWLYKNRLLSYVLEEYQEDRPFLHRAVKDFDQLFQIILENISLGLPINQPPNHQATSGELKEFREIKEKRAGILVVDDDEMMLRAAYDLLIYQGYQVFLAKNGKEALAILLEKRREVSLVILDVVLPGMSGEEIYRSIENLHPDMKVLFTSGYPINGNLVEHTDPDHLSFLNKPFHVDHLISRVQELLGESSAPSSS